MNRKMMCVAALVVVALGGCFFWQQHEKEAARNASTLTLSGNVDVREVSLAFRASDRIESLAVEEGDAVQKGQVLGQLANTELRLTIEKTRAEVTAQTAAVEKLHNGARAEEIAQAEANFRAAQAKAENASRVATRRRAVYAEIEGFSKQEVDDAIAQADAAVAQAAQADAAYQEALNGARAEDVAQGDAKLAALKSELARQEYLLRETTLIAPSDGIVRSRLLEVGDMASPAAAVYKLSLMDKKWVRAYVAESDLGRVREGQAAEVVIDSFPDKPIRGQVGFISGTAEFTQKSVQTNELRTSLLYEVRVYVEDADNVLRLGMPATVRIALR